MKSEENMDKIGVKGILLLFKKVSVRSGLAMEIVKVSESGRY